MKNTIFGLLFLCSLIAVLGCREHPKNWNGNWKLNTLKSSAPAEVITITVSADGEYHYNDGVVNTSFRCDGEFRPIGGDRTQNCVKTSPIMLDRIRKEHGVKTNTYHWELSPDGQLFTSTAIGIRANKPVLLGRLAAKRLSGSNGFAGQWQDLGFLQRHASFSLKLDDQYAHIGSESSDRYVSAPLSGVEVTVHGKSSFNGMTYAVRKPGISELIILGKLNGKEIEQESMKLSDDGKVISDTWSNPSHSNDKATLTYEKY